MRGGCARRIVPSTARAMRLVLGEVARDGYPLESLILRWCAWMRRTMCRPLSSRVALVAVTDLPAAVGFFGCDFANRSGRVLLAAGAGPTASKQLHVTWVIVEECDGSPPEMIRNYASLIDLSSSS